MREERVSAVMLKSGYSFLHVSGVRMFAERSCITITVTRTSSREKRWTPFHIHIDAVVKKNESPTKRKGSNAFIQQRNKPPIPKPESSS